ncbi:multidrug transporter [Deltaproteobacteria bacterium]|nr:multidrug transporter [Deltaproteobacteria bacterium]
MSPPSLPLRAVVALLLVQLLFGLHPVAAKLAFPAFGPGGVSLARVVGAALVFQAVRVARREPGLPWRVHGRVLVAALFGVVANQLLFVYGLARTTATHAALLIVMVPVVALIVAILAGRERFSPHRALGIVVALAGAALVVTGRGALSGGEGVGDAMVLGNAICYGIYLVLGRDLLVTIPPWTLAATLFTWAIPFVLLVTGVPMPVSPTPLAWAALASVVLGSTVGTYLLNLLALRSVPASVVAVFVCLQPIVAALLAIPLLDETLDARTLWAGVVTVVGMLVATRGAPEASRQGDRPVHGT